MAKEVARADAGKRVDSAMGGQVVKRSGGCGSA